MTTKLELEEEVKRLRLELEALRAERADEEASEDMDGEGIEGLAGSIGATLGAAVNHVTPDENVLRAVGSLAADIEEIARSKPTLAMIGALVIGLVIGRAFSR